MLHDHKTQLNTPSRSDGPSELAEEEQLVLKRRLEELKRQLEELKKNIEKQVAGKAKKNKLAQITDFYENLKKVGFILEQQLNQHIQNRLNDEDLVKLADGHSDWLAGHIKSLQKYVEVLSTVLLFPTKNDVANVAKLIIQTEEKVGQLEESMLKLAESMEEIKNLLTDSKETMNNGQ